MNIAANNIGIFISLLWGLVVFLLAFRGLEGLSLAKKTEPDQKHDSQHQRRRPLFEYVGMLISTLAQVCARLPLDSMRSNVAKRLKEAGTPAHLSPDEFFSWCLLSLLGLGAIGYIFDSSLELTPVCTIGLAILGIYYPRIWLSGYIIKRQRRIFRDLPDLLDTLRIAVAAGLDFSSALKVLVDTSISGPLLHEFEKVERDIALGQTRSNALSAMAERISMSEINAFVLAVRQADELGTSIGPVLAIQSEVARQRRWQQAEVQVGKLPMKLLGPLVLCIFPASFIILFTPLVLDYLQTGM